MQYRVIKNNCNENYLANLKKYHHTLSKIPTVIWGCIIYGVKPGRSHQTILAQI